RGWGEEGGGGGGGGGHGGGGGAWFGRFDRAVAAYRGPPRCAGGLGRRRHSGRTGPFRLSRGALLCGGGWSRGRRAGAECVVDALDELGDVHHSALILECHTGAGRLRAERDVDPEDQLVDGYGAVAVAGADALRPGRRTRCQPQAGGEQRQREPGTGGDESRSKRRHGRNLLERNWPQNVYETPK